MKYVRINFNTSPKLAHRKNFQTKSKYIDVLENCSAVCSRGREEENAKKTFGIEITNLLKFRAINLKVHGIFNHQKYFVLPIA